MGTLCLAGFSSRSHAADSEDLYNEIIFLRGLEIGAGGRALAMGGAYRAIAEDLSALYWNPAGLATVRRVELSLGISQALIQDDATIGENTVSNQLSRTRLNELGLVFPFPTYRGSLVFALGYHQVHHFDSFGTFQEVTQAYTFQADELETGRLGTWSLGMAIDISPMVSLGLGLNLWTGYDDYSYDDLTSWDALNWNNFNQSIDLDVSGFNAITGVLFRPSPWLSIAATLESPLKLSVNESYAETFEESVAGVYTSDSFSGSYEYKISRPFRGALGSSATVGPVRFSADAVFNDWTQITFSGEPPFIDLDNDEANREVARLLRPTIDLHAGAEFWVPMSPVRLQAGYAWLPSPFKSDEILTDKHLFSGGVSTLLDQSLLAQATITWSGWERTLGGWGEELQFTHLLLTVAYRF
jgi:long-subunit fatty acid transport protein